MIRQQIENELAHANFVLSKANSKRKQHEPTLAYFNGQANTCRKLLAVLDQAPLQIGIWLSWKSLAILIAGGIIVWLLH